MNTHPVPRRPSTFGTFQLGSQSVADGGSAEGAGGSAAERDYRCCDRLRVPGETALHVGDMSAER